MAWRTRRKDSALEASMQSEAESLLAPILPIAVIGMAFRGPGDATSPQKLWNMCCEGRDAWTEVPKSRFNLEGFWHPEAARPGCMNSTGGHFLIEDVSLFDASFFGINPDEARAMDPQHRLLLESSYEALENAGIPLQDAAGTKTGVFVGFCGSDYAALLCRDPETAPKYQTTGSAYSLLANHVSYTFDLKGPSCAVDTACSASLTALHLACQSLRTGEATQAIVGGVGVLLSPDIWAGMSSLGLFSQTGRCFSFDERAAGYGRGEGVATVVLKPLEAAIRDNDNIHSIIRHIGVNHDGRTRGIVYPNQQAQTQLIQRVYLDAGLDASETHYVEAHGPGTLVGDPIEAGALAEAIAAKKSRKLQIGSVKSNVGHMEGASGLAGFIKTCLVLEKGKIPPTATFRSPNKRIPVQEWNIEITAAVQEWPSDCIRRASVSSFGFGGANCHAILEGPPDEQTSSIYDAPCGTSSVDEEADIRRRPTIFVLSAADQSSAKVQAANLAEYLSTRITEPETDEFLDTLVYTLASRRSCLDWRLAVSARSREDLVRSLNNPNLGATKIPAKPAKLGFVFSGQGSQWPAMGQELMHDFPVFGAVIEQCDAYLQVLGAKWSLKDVIRGKSHLNINDPQISQSTTTSIQIGVTTLLKSWGLVPAKVIGHSSGEFAAAHAVGALSLESCLHVAYHRGRLASSLSNADKGPIGAMLAIGTSHAKANAMLKKVKQGMVSIACINSQSLVVASGDATGIQALETIVHSEKVFVQRLRVDVAYHSHHMHSIANEYLDCLEGITVSPGQPNRFYSTLRGQAIDQKRLDSAYWVEHLIRPVKFSTALEEMCFDFQTEDAGASMILIEIGPHSSLKSAINDIVKSHGWSHKAVYLPSLLSGQDATSQMVSLASNLFVKGQQVDLEAVNFPNGRSRLRPLGDLPAYAWRHDRPHWHESRLSRNYRLRSFPRNDLLGSLVHDYSDLEPRWRNILRTKDLPWLLHHVIQGAAVFPFAAYISMAIEASQQWTIMNSSDLGSPSRYEFREVHSSRPLVIAKASDVETSLTLRNLADGTRSLTSMWNEFIISSYTSDQGWMENCRGHIRTSHQTVAAGDSDMEGRPRQHEALEEAARYIEQACKEPVNCAALYRKMSRMGLDYGPTFRNLYEARAAPGFCVGHVKTPRIAEVMPHVYQTRLVVHPALLDACFHPLLVSAAARAHEAGNLYLPNFIQSFSISSNVGEMISENYICYGTSHLEHPRQLQGTSLRVFGVNQNGQIPFIDMHNMTGVGLPQDDFSTHVSKPELCYKLVWEPLKDLGGPDGGTTMDALTDSNAEAVTFTFVSQPDENLIQSINRAMNDTNWAISISALEDTVPENRYYVFLDHTEPILRRLNAQRLILLQNLFATAKGILWVTSGSRSQTGKPASSMSAGWSRCLRSEMANLKLVTLDLDILTNNNYDKMAGILRKTLPLLFLDGIGSFVDAEYAEIDGLLMVPRLISDGDKNEYVAQQLCNQAPVPQPFKQLGRNLHLEPSKLGVLEAAIFTESDITSMPLGEDEVEIEIFATGMNFKDIMVSLRQIEYEGLGLECSGFVTKLGKEAQGAGFKIGDRVCAVAKACYANITRATHTNTIRIPNDMNFVSAASVPIVYCTAYHALFEAGSLKKDDAVLIHSAAGGVGQAAVMFAKHAGAKVFATVGTDEKSRLLMEHYEIPHNHIFSSRGFDFERGILEATNGKGVELVLGSVSAETRRLSLSLLRPLGRFIEIGKRDLELNAYLEMNNFRKALSFSAVDLEILGRSNPIRIRRILDTVFAALKDFPQVIKPVTPITTFPPSQIETAMRTMQGRKHMGKIVIEAKDDDYVLAEPPRDPPVLRADVTYLITGGTGGIGQSLTRWMALEGAKSIILASRSGQTAAGIQTLMQDMEKKGVNVIVQECNVGSESDVERLISSPTSHGIPPIAGIIHGAMVLQDVLFEKSAIEDYLKVLEPRVQGAWNLHNATLASKTELDFFIVLSSTSGILGNPGQSAYAASNSFLDAFAQFRQNMQLPASSIDLGLVDEVGYVSRNMPNNMSGDAIVHNPLKERELHVLVKATIVDKSPKCNYVQTITGVKLDPTRPLPFWARDPKMAKILPSSGETIRDSDDNNGPLMSEMLKRCLSKDEATLIVCEALTTRLSTILLTPKEELDVHKNMNAFGLDSLVAVEIRNWMAREIGVDLSLLEFMKLTTLFQLSEVAAGKSRFLGHLLSD